VSGYQFCITIGLLLAAVVDNSTMNRMDSGSYRIPIAIQFAWALILGTGLFLLPEVCLLSRDSSCTVRLTPAFSLPAGTSLVTVSRMLPSP
jgi:hypothetical protein